MGCSAVSGWYEAGRMKRGCEVATARPLLRAGRVATRHSPQLESPPSSDSPSASISAAALGDESSYNGSRWQARATLGFAGRARACFAARIPV
jgi:hypothetical protein